MNGWTLRYRRIYGGNSYVHDHCETKRAAMAECARLNAERADLIFFVVRQ